MMLHVVEVPVSSEPEHFAEVMGQMRAWLDHMHYEPTAFRQLRGGLLCRVDFTDEAQATGFAKAFSGRLLSAANA